MLERRAPQRLQDAQVELETIRWLWESTEEQVSSLVDATVQRIRDGSYPFYEDIDEAAILQRERVKAEMRRAARATALIQAWVLFEDVVCWFAEDAQRKGQAVGKRRTGESLTAWAARELSLCANSHWGDEILEWLELLSRLRNLLVHTNGQYSRMQPGDQARVGQWVATRRGVMLRNGRLEVQPHFVETTFRVVSMAIFALSGLLPPKRT